MEERGGGGRRGEGKKIKGGNLGIGRRKTDGMEARRGKMKNKQCGRKRKGDGDCAKW